jgi:3-hydroxyacyl-[acyl-carrier-protein] dehydratase
MEIGTFAISREDPSLDGHFPGQPVVPGVVILAECLALIEAALGKGPVAALRDVKFRRPLAPEESVAVRYAWQASDRINFAGYVGDAVLVSGVALLEVTQP